MRLHLVISRHGLPVTRILWTTSAASAGEYGARHPASTAAVASSRTPNIAFSNGGYTVAQLLEDVNEVVPLETEPHVFDEELSGQWGLEDYVVEVAGSECLHFMEVDGLLRDGDEVVIRALQLADLRTRRLCGRHQITSEGKHLIDGVPFGSPFLKRSTTSRPAITIPPRKKRRTVFSGWEHGPEFSAENALNEPSDEEGDGDWVPPHENGLGKELSIMPAEHEESMGTVIRHPIDHLARSESEDMSEIEEAENENELESELQALKDDFEEPSQFVDIRNSTRGASGNVLRAASVSKRPTSKGSLVGASSLSDKRSRGDDSSPRASKAVRFNGGNKGIPEPEPAQAEEPAVESSASSESDSDSDSDSESDSGDASSSEVEPAPEAVPSSSQPNADSDSDSDSDSSSSSDSSDSSDSESEEEAAPAPKAQPAPALGLPFQGSTRTKKSNSRLKLRRRLSKLKELGALPDEADFDALRAWETTNGGWFTPEQSMISEEPAKPQNEISPEKSAKQLKQEKKEQEQKEFEARRQKLLRDLESGNGVDVDQASEKENRPPRTASAEAAVSKPASDEDRPEKQSSKEAAHRRTLDLASSRRMLFGSLGVRTPKTKEEEEKARQKLAAKASATGHQKRPSQVAQPEVDQMDVDEDEDDDGTWRNKLIVRAVECVHPEIEMTAPPYPFVQRWDKEANALIREKKGPGKKRKRKQRIQVYNNEEEEYDENGNWYGEENYQENDQGYYDAEADPYYQGHYAGEAEGNGQLNYDEGPEPESNAHGNDDLPLLPSDVSSVPDLCEKDVKVGSIIAFRQLDMSKATNWQPQMSEYRVAEVRSIKEQGVINVLLAKRDRRQRQAGEGEELRQFSKFEVPDLANDEEEDDGYRELDFAELSDPKLLQPAASGGDQTGQEGSIVSVVEESVPNAQTASEMDLDETTFVTIGNEVSYLDSPRDSPGSPDDIQRTPGPGGLPQIQVQSGSDPRSVTPPIQSPSFTGFHSAQSRQQVTPGLESNLEGCTLLGGETPSALTNREEDPSMLSFASANQSFDDAPEETLDQQDRQVVEDLAPPVESGESGPQSASLLSTIGSNGGVADSQPAKEIRIKDEKSRAAPRSSQSWNEMLDGLRDGTDEIFDLSSSDVDLPDDKIPEDTPGLERELQHSANGQYSLPPQSPQPPTSEQGDPSNPTDPTHLLNFFSPAASAHPTKSQPARESAPDRVPESQFVSQVPASQASMVIDLTSSPAGSPQPESNVTPSRGSQSARSKKKQDPLQPGPSRAPKRTSQSTGWKTVNPPQSQKKRRTSRKF